MKAMLRKYRWQWASLTILIIVGFLTVLGTSANDAEPQAKKNTPTPQAKLTAPVQSFLKNHCYDCHDGESKRGGFDLTALPYTPSDPDNFSRWVKVFDKVHKGDMPPRAEANLPGKDNFLTDMSKVLTAEDKARQEKYGRCVVRRLNRVEFETAVSDLLGVPLDIRELLPPDPTGHGFDTVGKALSVSAVQMESYLNALDVALDRATHLVERPKTKTWKLSYLHSNGMMQEYRRTGPFTPLKDGVAMFAPDFFSHFNSLLDHYVIPHNGRYKVKVSAYALRTKTPITLTVRMGGPGHRESDSVRKKLLGNVSVETGKPQIFEFEETLERGQMFRIYPSSLRKMRFVSPKWFHTQKSYKGPGVVVQWVQVEGPIFDSWPPPSHQRLYAAIKTEPIPDVEPNRDFNKHLKGPPNRTAKPKHIFDPKNGIGGEKIYPRTRINQPLHPTLKLVSDQPQQDAERLLKAFMPKAYRRPVTDAEMRPYLALIHHWLKKGATFEQAMRTGYKAVLVSPGFLYHQASGPVVNGNTELTDYQLAERLAFFLWSSLPDEPLLKVAAAKKLSDPAELRKQVDRMLNDPKAERFLENFLGQWLDLRLIDFTSPDSELYPEFDSLLKWSMVEETKAFFRELMTDDLSVSNIIDSDFAMLNDRLAKLYKIPGVRGIHLRKVKLPENSTRGGVLAHGSILKVTANGTTTSPVVRGVWVSERILGNPPEPPPPGVPAIEPDIRGATTVREQLAKHRSIKSCASCHAQFDPLGMALESYDVIGGWREHYRALKPIKNKRPISYNPGSPPPILYKKGLPVDASDVLPSGKKFADIRELKTLLLQDRDPMARTVAEKLVVYGTGAPISFADRAEIRTIIARTRPDNHGFRSLIHEVVQSRLFRSK